jgi:hypothetical protein
VDSTPPYNSLFRTVPNADRVEVLCVSTVSVYDLELWTSISDLERKVFKGMGNARFTLESAPSFYEECDR